MLRLLSSGSRGHLSGEISPWCLAPPWATGDEVCGRDSALRSFCEAHDIDVVVDEIKAWQSRPLDEVYPILYIDGIRIRVKDNGVVTTKVAYLAIGVDVDGRKHALGCWIAVRIR